MRLILYPFVAAIARLAVRSGRSKDLEIVLRHPIAVLRHQIDRGELIDDDRTLLGAIAAALPRRQLRAGSSHRHAVALGAVTTLDSATVVWSMRTLFALRDTTPHHPTKPAPVASARFLHGGVVVRPANRGKRAGAATIRAPRRGRARDRITAGLTTYAGDGGWRVAPAPIAARSRSDLRLQPTLNM